MLNRAVNAARSAGRKIPWATRQVGVIRIAVGVARLSALALTRPCHAHVMTKRDHLCIFFRYPSQLMPTLVVFGEMIEPEFAVLPRVLGPGSIVIDVGASIGTWTMLAARAGATVHACEPDPDNLKMLAANVAANGLASQVTAHCLAIGSRPGNGTLITSPKRYLNSITETADGSTGCVITTADLFVENLGIGEIDLLKINTAGTEHEVLAGAQALFSAGRIKLAMILDGSTIWPILDQIQGPTYDIGVYAQGRFISVERSADLAAAKIGPMARYVFIRRRDILAESHAGRIRPAMRV